MEAPHCLKFLFDLHYIQSVAKLCPFSVAAVEDFFYFH